MEEKSLLELVNNALEMLTEIKARLENDSRAPGENNDETKVNTSNDAAKPMNLVFNASQPTPSAQQFTAAPQSVVAPQSTTAQQSTAAPQSASTSYSAAPQSASTPKSTVSPYSTDPQVATTPQSAAPQSAFAQPSSPVQSNNTSKGGIRLEFGGYSQTISSGGAFAAKAADRTSEGTGADNQPAISAARRPEPVAFSTSQTAGASPANTANPYAAANAYNHGTPDLSANESAKAFDMPDAPAPSAFRFCKNCGSPIKPTAKFCRNCGERL